MQGDLFCKTKITPKEGRKERKELRAQIGNLERDIGNIEGDSNFVLSPEDQEGWEQYLENKKSSKRDHPILIYENEKDFYLKRFRISLNVLRTRLKKVDCDVKGHIYPSGSLSRNCLRCNFPRLEGKRKNPYRIFYFDF